MYETWHPTEMIPTEYKAKINYTVWSDVFVCPQCGKEISLWDVAVDIQNEVHEILEMSKL